MDAIPAVRVRTRSAPPPPASWPNGAEVYRHTPGGKPPLMGWIIRVANKYRAWVKSDSPIYLCDSDSFLDALNHLSTDFDKRIAVNKSKSKRSNTG